MQGRLFLALCAFVAGAWFVAQTGVTLADDLDNVAFEGVVKDATGAVLEDAVVTARSTATKLARVARTDSRGRYRILANAAGDYLIEAAASGFANSAQELKDAATGKSYTIDFTLGLQGVSEQVRIAGATLPLLDTTRTVAGDTIGEAELDSLPLIDRDPLAVVFLLGGVAEPPLATTELADEGRDTFLRGTPEEAGIFSLTGSSATSNNLTIDGLDNNDDRSAQARISLSPESVAEVQVVTNQYAAEYGRASGGRINVMTRGGANRLKGEGYIFFGDESLNANTFFRNARGAGRIPEQRFREGWTVSGPLQTNRHFFFAAFERLDVSDFVEVNTLLPVATNPRFPLPRPTSPAGADKQVAAFQEELSTPESRNLFNARLDFAFRDSHNLAVRLDAVRGRNRRGFPGRGRLAETILIQGRDSDSASVSDTIVLSRNVVNQARFQVSRLLPRNHSSGALPSIVIEDPARVLAGGFAGTDSSPAFARQENRVQLQNALIVSLGAHQLKTGIDAQLVRSTFTDLFAAGGQFTFASVTDFVENRVERFVQRFDTESRLSNGVLGLFVQDEWRLRPWLTLSLGLRFDKESILKDADNISPRIAVAWDPFGAKAKTRGSTVIRAGFGVFYNRALLRTLDDFSIGSSKIRIDSDITPALLTEVRFPQAVTDAAIIKEYGRKETGFLRRVSPDLEIPYTIQTGVGVERMVTRKAAVTADYVFTRGAHLWRESNINAPVLPAGFATFTDYLLGRDFDNRPLETGARPIVGTNADVVRFDLGAGASTTPGAVVVENGLRVLTLGLNAPRSSNIKAALNAVRDLRPDPSLTQVEMLESTGNSFYHGGIFSLKWSTGRLVTARVSYTLSKLIDEGTTNTASPQDGFDRRAERSLSLQDQRHRINLNGVIRVPLLKLELAPVVSFGSSRPFNIGVGVDRNLNDVTNDRPLLSHSIERPRWREQGSAQASLKDELRLAPIGSSGNLPRNYGRGPSTRTVNLRASRTFLIRERARLRPAVDVFNLFNNTVFSFGSEFINRDDSDFLVPRRTQRARVIQLSLKALF